MPTLVVAGTSIYIGMINKTCEKMIKPMHTYTSVACCWCFSLPCWLQLPFILYTCPCKLQKAWTIMLQHVQHPLVVELDLVLQILHEFADKINIHCLFNCPPFSSCLKNLLYLNLLLCTTHITCIIVISNIYGLSSAIVDMDLFLYHPQGWMLPKCHHLMAPDFKEQDRWNMHLEWSAYIWGSGLWWKQDISTLCIKFICVIDQKSDCLFSRACHSFLKSLCHGHNSWYRPFWTSKWSNFT